MLFAHAMDATADTNQTFSFTDSNSECEMLKSVISARDSEILVLFTRLQQNNDMLAIVVERLEKTVSASIDRFVRRLDRMDNRQDHTTGSRNGYTGERNKRVRYR